MKLIVEDLMLARGGRVLFAPLTFAAGRGHFVEVRGANGAGKTSLLRALAGWIRPVSGRIAYEGVDEPPLALAYLGHRDALKPAISARAHVRHWAGLLGGEGGDDALARTGLGALGDLPARVFSQGQQRRLALARLIAAPRPIWLLDEPAAALDAAGKTLLAELVAAHVASGGIAVAAAHEPIGPNPDQIIVMERAP